MTTSLVLPREDRPAVRAKGTVRPSAKPMVMSRMRSPLAVWCSEWGASSSGFPRDEYFMEGRLSAAGRTRDVGVVGARSTAGSTGALRPMSGCVSEGMDMVGWVGWG